jgi:hypothetical protein
MRKLSLPAFMDGLGLPCSCHKTFSTSSIAPGRVYRGGSFVSSLSSPVRNNLILLSISR